MMEAAEEKASQQNRGDFMVEAAEEKAPQQNPQRGISAYWKGIILFVLLLFILNIFARIPAVCDSYTDHIFPLWLETYGRVTALFPFSVGEVLLISAVSIVIFWLLSIVLFLFFRANKKYRRYIRWYSKSILVFLLVVLLVMTLNCSMLYGCSRLNVKGNRDKTYSSGELRELWNYAAARCNELAGELDRDEQGTPVYDGDVNEAVRQAMQKLSGTYPRLQGRYPDPKPIYFSYVMYQADCTGVYFPFSMEANYNSYLSDLGYPSVAAHELAHLKGYIYEDEADFMAYLACVGSGEPYLQYSGYLSILGYLQGDYLESVQDTAEDTRVSEQVYEDHLSFYFTPETREEFAERESVFDKETVETISEGITDTYMDYYHATPNYAEVTKLMLAYYDGILY